MRKIFLFILFAILVSGAAAIYWPQEAVKDPNDSRGMATSTNPGNKTGALESGVVGTVAFHSCPGVVMEGREPSCSDEPAIGFNLTIENIDGSVARQVTTDNAGSFKVDLKPGNYVIKKPAGISGGDTPITVESGKYATVNIKYLLMRP
jgi:hypothetical protein